MNKSIWDTVWKICVLMFLLGIMVILAQIREAHSAEPIHYTEWLTFTDNADRERQIDSVGAIVDTAFVESHYITVSWIESGEWHSKPDSFWQITSRQIVTWEIREWPNTELKYKGNDYPFGEYDVIEVPGKFRVAWKEE